jgi:hypothetical protein
MMIHEHEYLRAEFDWLASDEDGLVAYLSTAGFGPLPKEVIEVAEQLEGLLSRVIEMTPRGEGIPVSGVLNPRDWMDAAARGFYAYDWSSINKRYELVAMPSSPLHMSEITNSELRMLVARIRLPVRLVEARYIAE